MIRAVELTPRGRGAISVLVLEGHEVVARLEALVVGGLKNTRQPRLCRLSVRGAEGAGEALDEALVWRRPDGAVEVHMHGSPVLVQRVLGLLGTRGEVHSVLRTESLCGGLVETQGELERRAAKRLIAAPTARAAHMLLDQAGGALRKVIELWLRSSCAERAAIATGLQQRGFQARWIFDVPRIVLAGPVNMGKSTLFNLLIGQQRVVVSDLSGTTRDVISERAMLAGIEVQLVDTAGWRRASGPAAAVEEAGQLQAYQACEAADLVLWLARGERPPAFKVPLIEFFGRADEPGSQARMEARRIAPLCAPQAALKEVEQATSAALGLCSVATGVGIARPFDHASRELVQAMLEAPDSEATRQAVLAALC